MTIRTKQSCSGFIASNPQLSVTERGDARLYARIGQEHHQRNADGTFIKLDATFHDLVLFRGAAERANEQFRKGDRFLAEGYTRTYDHHHDGNVEQREEFVATKIGHDNTTTRYSVDRTPRPKATADLGRSL